MPSKPDWEECWRAGEDYIPDYEIVNQELADKAVALFKSFIVSDLDETETERLGNRAGDLCGEWFLKLVRALWGSVDPVTKERLLKEIFCLVPKKSSKTTFAALLMLTALFMSTRKNDRFVLVAPTIETAKMAFDIAAGALTEEPKRFNSKVVKIQDHRGTITRLKTGAKLIIKAASTRAVTGVKASGILIDETHELATKPNANKIFTELRGSRVARKDGFLIQISTMPQEPLSGLMDKELKRATDVRDGVADQSLIDETLPVLYMWPRKELEEEAWRNEELWERVNPAWNASVNPKTLHNEYLAALGSKDPNKEVREFASKHLNVEIDIGLMGDRWEAADIWADCVSEDDLRLGNLVEMSDLITCGIDAGGMDDFLSLAVIGRHRETGVWMHWCCNWVDAGVLTRRPKYRDLYRDFEAEGSLLFASGGERGQARRDMADVIVGLQKTGKLPAIGSIGLDRFGAKLFPEALFKQKVTPKRVGTISQAGWLHGIIETVSIYLNEGSMVHGGTKLMNWCMGNARIQWSKSSKMITKDVAVDKIDPVIAMLNACDRMVYFADKRVGDYTARVYG